jgi:hypothetical protein
VSGWSADNAGNGDNAADAPSTAGSRWSAAPPDEPPAAWAMPEAPNDHAWAQPETGGTGADIPIGAATASGTGPDASTTAGAGGGWTSDPEPVAPPRLPVTLKAMTATDIIDGAWGILKARPRTVFTVTAIIMLPAEIISAFLGGGSFWTLFRELIDPGSVSTTAVLGMSGIYLGALLQSMSLILLGGAIARLVSSWYAGGDMTAREAVMSSLRKAPALLGAWGIVLPVKALAAAPCLVGLPFVIPLFMVIAPVIVIEDLGPIAGVKRAFHLARRRYWPCIGVWSLALVVELTVNFSLRILPELLADMAPDAVESVIAGASTVFAAFVSAPFVVGVAMLLYLDLRVRTEGLDLELEATTAFTRAA